MCIRVSDRRRVLDRKAHGRGWYYMFISYCVLYRIYVFGLYDLYISGLWDLRTLGSTDYVMHVLWAGVLKPMWVCMICYVWPVSYYFILIIVV